MRHVTTDELLQRARAVIPNGASSGGRAKFQEVVVCLALTDADVDETVQAAARALAKVS